MTVTLPLPPSSNTAYKKTFKTRRLYLTPEGKKWKLNAVEVFKKYTPFTTPVEIHIRLYFPDMKVRDHWNYHKLAVDSIVEAGLISDDRWQVNPDAHLHAELCRDNPRIDIVVTPLH